MAIPHPRSPEHENAERRPAAAPSRSDEPGAVLLLASTGGHLSQLQSLSERLLAPGEARRWATFDTPQSRSALTGQTVDYLSYIAPRDARGVARGFLEAERLLRRVRPSRIISTGSGVAVPFFVVGRAMGIPCDYLESAARAVGPSVTGRLVSRIPGVGCYTQYTSWAGRRWQSTCSVFDQYSSASALVAPAVRSLVVTLGTIEGYGFERLLRRLMDVVPAGVDVFWQLAPQDVGRLDIPGAHGQVPQAQLLDRIARADAVVAHAGIGSALSVLDAGLRPVLVPRLAAHQEHVDDHQLQIAGELDHRFLALARDASELTWADIVANSACRVTAA